MSVVRVNTAVLAARELLDAAYDPMYIVGGGVEAGEADKPLCWWKVEGADTYRILYGDFTARDAWGSRSAGRGAHMSDSVNGTFAGLREGLFEELCVFCLDREEESARSLRVVEPCLISVGCVRYASFEGLLICFMRGASKAGGE